MNLSWKNTGPALVLIVLTFVAFGASLRFGYAPLDDHFLIVNNLLIRAVSLSNLQAIFTSYDPELYIPLTLLSYQLNYMVGALDPLGFHIVNILLHVSNGLLVYLVIKSTTGASKTLATFIAASFVVHPLMTQSVVWISGRKDLLMTLFFLASLLAYTKERPKLSLSLFLLALLAKVTAVTLPIILILYNILTRSGDSRVSATGLFRKLIPYLVLSILFIAIAFGGKSQIVGSTNPLKALVVAIQSIAFGLQKVIAPMGLSIFYPYTPSTVALVISILVMSTLLISAWKVRNTYRWGSFGLIIFLVTIAPSLINLKTGGDQFLFADRYAYLPMLGIAFILYEIGHRLSPKSTLIIGIVMITVLTSLTIRQVNTWKTPEKLFAHAVGLYPNSVNARAALAKVYRESGKYEQAFEVLREGLTYGDHVKLYLGAGTIYAKVGQTRDAAEQFSKAMDLDPSNPEPYFYLGSLEEQLGNDAIALPLYEKAVALDPSYAVARLALGNLYLRANRTEDANEQLQEALRWNPNLTVDN